MLNGLNWLGEFVKVYHAMLLPPKICLFFLKRQPWVSLVNVTLLVGVHKCLRNFWFKRVEDCYIRLSQTVETKSGFLLTFVLKQQKEIYYVKAYLWGLKMLVNNLRDENRFYKQFNHFIIVSTHHKVSPKFL